MGIDPHPFTLRELVGMAEGRNRAEWLRTSGVMVASLNVWLPKNKQLPLNHFVPGRRMPRGNLPKVRMKELREGLIKGLKLKERRISASGG